MYKQRRTYLPTCMCATWNLTSVYTTSFGKSESDVEFQGIFLFASRALTYAHGWPPVLRFTAKVFRIRRLFFYAFACESPRNRSTGDDERSRGHAWFAGQRLIVPAACEASLLSRVSQQMTRYTRGRVIEEGKIDRAVGETFLSRGGLSFFRPRHKGFVARACFARTFVSNCSTPWIESMARFTDLWGR